MRVQLNWSHPHAWEYGEVDTDEEGRVLTIGTNFYMVRVLLENCPHGVRESYATPREFNPEWGLRFANLG